LKKIDCGALSFGFCRCKVFTARMPLLTATSEFGLGRTDAGVLIDSVTYTVSSPFHALGRYKLSRIRRRVQSVGCGCRAGKRANPIRRFGGDLSPVRAEVLLCRYRKLQQLSADTTAVKPAHLSSFLASFFFFSSAAVFNQTRVSIFVFCAENPVDVARSHVILLAV